MKASAGACGQWSTKAALRARLLAARRELDEDTLAEAGRRVAHALDSVVTGAGRIASYLPLPFEPRPPALRGAWLPVVLPDGDLDWEREGVRQGVDAIAAADLVLVPAVAVDRHGARLGRGGGCYDRALARTTARTVALLHDGELLDTLPIEPHDVRVGWVVTPMLGLVRLPM